MFNKNSESVKIGGHRFHWSVIDSCCYKGKTFYLFECDELGDMANFIIADAQGLVYTDDWGDGLNIAIRDGILDQTEAECRENYAQG